MTEQAWIIARLDRLGVKYSSHELPNGGTMLQAVLGHCAVVFYFVSNGDLSGMDAYN